VYLAKVFVTLKPTVNDPQGLTVQGALKTLGFASVESVRLGKYLEIKIDETESAKAEALASDMCQKLLANPVIEEYRIELEELAPVS
jgi:phosphoribosylformylglycinamidine synthase PurS subunit